MQKYVDFPFLNQTGCIILDNLMLKQMRKSKVENAQAVLVANAAYSKRPFAKKQLNDQEKSRPDSKKSPVNAIQG